MVITHLYIIGRRQGPVKVGISSQPTLRLSTIRTGCPFEIHLFHAEPMRNRRHALWHELNFHEVHNDKRLVGEWFDLDAELAVESVLTALEIERHFEARL